VFLNKFGGNADTHQRKNKIVFEVHRSLIPCSHMWSRCRSNCKNSHFDIFDVQSKQKYFEKYMLTSCLFLFII